MYYREPVFRPPSEAYSLLLQVTEGCTYRCDFCISNLNKTFKIRSIDEIKKDLDISKKLYGTKVKKIFFLDGNAFVIKPNMLIEIANYCFKIYPNLERIGAYAHAKDVLRKSDFELNAIAKAGLRIAYVGIESGDNDVLKKVHKQTTAEELIEAAQKLHRANIQFSGTIILGLAGNNPELSRKHAICTSNLINKMNPPKSQKWYLSALTLMLPPGTPLQRDADCGTFHPITNREALLELKWIIENISEDLHDCVWRSNHASNYLPLKGILSQDKQKLLQQIEFGLDHPESLRSEFFRAL